MKRAIFSIILWSSAASAFAVGGGSTDGRCWACRFIGWFALGVLLLGVSVIVFAFKKRRAAGWLAMSGGLMAGISWFMLEHPPRY